MEVETFKKQAVLGSLLGLLGSRLANTGITAAMRSARSPLRNFYANMAHNGFTEGFNRDAAQLLPKLRRPLTQRFGPGLAPFMDYDVAKVLGGEARHHFDALKSSHPSLAALAPEQALSIFRNSVANKTSLRDLSTKLNMRPRALVSAYKQLPTNIRELAKSRNADFSSPVLRHVNDALSGNIEPSSLANFSKRFYSTAPIAQQTRNTTALGALNGGLQELAYSGGNPINAAVGLVSGAAEAAPEALLLGAAGRGRNSALMSFKSRALALGRDAHLNPGSAASYNAKVIGALDSNAREFILAGKDVARNSNLSSMNKLQAGEVAKLNHSIDTHGTNEHLLSGVKKDIVEPLQDRLLYGKKLL